MSTRVIRLLVCAALLASCAAVSSPNVIPFTTMGDVAKSAIDPDPRRGTCGQHPFVLVRAIVGNQRYFVYSSPESMTVIFARVENDQIDTITITNVGPGGALTIVDTHAFAPDGRDSTGPCGALFPSVV